MRKKRAIEIVESLISAYRSEYEGTTNFEERHEEHLEALRYIKKNLGKK